MEKSTFNPMDWLPDNQVANPPKPEKTNTWEDSTVEMDIERVVNKIESTHTDLTATYQEWLQIGFALAHELGEMGRSYFHRISRFYPKYTVADCDKKYDNCLKGNSQGITIKTFFYLAKQAGIEIGQEKPVQSLEKKTEVENPENEPLADQPIEYKTPELPEKVYENLPCLLAESCRLFNDGIEKDIFFLSALTVLSSCLPNIEGTYFNRTLSPHLYLFITGPSASGKGTMVWSRYLAQEIHAEMCRGSAIEKGEYLIESEKYENLKKQEKNGLQKPIEPPRRLFFIPANCSTAALIQILTENNFRGLIFETEADTLSNAAKQDWGDSSDIFRKAFHHENTSMARRQNNELFEITNPHLAICLSGTPRQIHHLMPEVENGLFSRFMYYTFQDGRGFLNPFVSYQPINYHNYFTQKSWEVFHLYERLQNQANPIAFQLTNLQGLLFTNYFSNLLKKNTLLLSRDLDANTKRLGVITFRIAMVLSALRLMDQEPGVPVPTSLICSDVDFETAMTIATTLETHATAVYQQMPKVNLKGLRLSFFEKLPQKFDRKKYLEVADQLGIGSKTAEKYIALFKTKLLDHTYNEYTKKKREET